MSYSPPTSPSSTWNTGKTAFSKDSSAFQPKASSPENLQREESHFPHKPWFRVLSNSLRNICRSRASGGNADPEKASSEPEQHLASPNAADISPSIDDGVSGTNVRHLEDCPEGYSRLAAFNASDQNFMLYRGFSYVHARLLLDLQAEIAELEGELDDLDSFDHRKGKTGLLRSRAQDISDAQDVEEAQVNIPPQERQDTRRRILEKLQEKVSKYDDLLIKSRELASFQKPSDRDYRSVRNWFHNYRPLVETEEEYVKWREDIVTLRHGREWAGFDGLIENMLQRMDCPLIRKLFCSPDLRRKTDDRKLTYFSPARVEKLVDLIITCIIFILLVIPVVAMYRLTSFGTSRDIFSAIGVLIVFTLLFAAVMSLLTKARRHELFAASAAYCAVLVVFIENFS